MADMNEAITGNMMKMREALVLALSLLDLKEGVPYKTVSQKDLDFMKDALAAPPRNCDRLPNRAAAIEAYQKDTGFNKHPVVLWTAAQIYAFIDWLFATKKGDEE